MKNRSWWVYILIFIVSQLIGVGVGAVLTIFFRQKHEAVVWAMSVALFMANALAVALFFCFRPHNITWSSTLAGFKGRTGRRTLLAFLMAVPLSLLVNIIQETFFPDLPDIVGAELMAEIIYNPFGLLAVAIVGPVAEELLFRGGVQTDLHNRFAVQGPAVAIGFSACLFSLIHMNPAQMPLALILGVALGFAYWWTGSLVAPFLIHIFNNSFACLLGFLAPDADTLSAAIGGPTEVGILSLVCVFFFVLTLLAIRKEGLKSTEMA